MSELRRGLNVWEAIGISIALMAPSMAANINPQATAGSVGRAVPLAFGLATVGVLLVAYAFVRLCQHFHHAGSVYGFVGATLGARTGLVAGWALMGTYVLYGVVTSTAAGIFGASFLDELGLWTRQPSWAPFLIGALALLGVLALTVSPVRSATLACGVGAARLAFAFGRDGVAPTPLGGVSERRGTPHVAALTVVVMMGAAVLLDAVAFGTGGNHA